MRELICKNCNHSETLEKINDIQMFVLDDAFQHRKLKCKLNICIITIFDNF